LGLCALLLVTGAVILPRFFAPNVRRAITGCKANLKNIGTALEMYSTDTGGSYPRSLTALAPKYFKTIPFCEAAGQPNYKVYFGRSAPFNAGGQEDYYFVECAGENHTSVGVTANYPAYNGIQGLIERAP
jgi:hypothetical protein